MLGSLLSNQLQREDLLQTLEKRVADQTRQLTTFYEMTMLSAGSQELPDILNPALSRIQEVSKSEAACIHVYLPEEQVLLLVAHRGIPQSRVVALERIPIQENHLDWLNDTESGQDIKNRMPGEILQRFTSSDFGTLLISKLSAAGKTLGVISCFRISNQPYTPFQVSILEIIGDLLGVVIENQRLTQETRKLATIQERQRLARELHDAVSQSIYSLTLFARSAKDALEANDRPKLLENLEHLEVNSLTVLKEMRLLLYQLRTIALEEGDLEKAIETRFDLVERRSGIQAEINYDNRIHLSPDREQEYFRVITEALNNSLYYSEASRVTVDIRPEDGQVLLVVEDNGIGFNPSQIRAGMGMMNMRERAEALKGTLEINSQPGQGTCVRFLVPGELVKVGDDSNER
jgi:signal transduction histidine kinase